MRSTLFRIPYEIYGIPLFGVGLLLAVWAVAAAVAIAIQVKRRGWGQETMGTLSACGIVAAIIIFLPRFFPEGLPIRGYGLSVLIGASLGIWMSSYRTRQMGLHGEVMVSLCMWMIIGGIVGARLFYVLQYWNKEIRQDTWSATLAEIFNFPSGGLVIYGALLAGAAMFFYFNWRHKLPPLAMGDLLGPGVAVGIALGRIGCFLNGCCYGGVCELPWAVQFPGEPTMSPPYVQQVQSGQMHGFRISADDENKVVVAEVRPNTAASEAELAVGDAIGSINGQRVDTLNAAYSALHKSFVEQQVVRITTIENKQVEFASLQPPTTSLPVHPTQLYSAVNGALLAAVLWFYFPFRRSDGEVGALLMILYSVTRFMLEFVRTDEPSQFGTGLTISQLVSVAIFITGVALFAWLRSKPPRLSLPLPSRQKD